MHHRPTPAGPRCDVRGTYTRAVPPILPPGPVDQAQRVVLRKINHRAPKFLNHLVRSRLIGHQVEVGERILVFQVAFTVPGGLVEVTDSTIIEFIE
jgi:hypothetical protein